VLKDTIDDTIEKLESLTDEERKELAEKLKKILTSNYQWTPEVGMSFTDWYATFGMMNARNRSETE